MKYLKFELIKDTGKTKVYSVNTLNGNQLGVVGWYAPWRKYCFGTVKTIEAVFDVNCLKEVQDFITKLMEDRKNGSTKR